MQPIQEVWLPVPEEAGRYEVSDQGRVRNAKTGRILRPGKSGLYFQVRLSRKSRRVHRLVTLAFLGPCPDGLEVRHLDGDSENNALPNLCYGTKSENALDVVRHGRGINNRIRASGWFREPRKECREGHALTGNNLIIRARKDWDELICRACKQAYRQTYWEKFGK